MSSGILIIPAFNEAGNLPLVLRNVHDVGVPYEIVVIDDGSTDATAEVAERHGASVIRHPFNLGYGSALQTGYKYARRRGASVLVQMDADGQHDPRDIPKLTGPIERGESDLVLGSRFLKPTEYVMSSLHKAGREVFRLLARLSGLRLTDPTSGFQAMSHRVLALYTTDFYPTDYPDVDVLLSAHRHGLRISECAVHMSKGLRASSLHGGWRSFYYVYRTMLSIWAATATRRSGIAPSREG